MYKIINLETFGVPNETKYSLLKNEIGFSNKILGLMLADGFIHENPGQLIQKISQETDLTIVAGLAGHKTCYEKVITFDFNMHVTYLSYLNKPTYDWNSECNTFLFLGGVPDRPNRVGLLLRFFKENLLDNSCYTFFKPWTNEQQLWCINYLKEDYAILETLEKKIDDIYSSSKHYGTSPSDNEWTKNIAWIDPCFFKNTCLSIISEGISHSDITSEYITEKTFRAFVNRHPFIHASNPEMFNYIKKLGFKTFEEYMAIPDYAYKSNEEDRLDCIVTNTKHFLENLTKYRKNIYNDVQHNYELFFTLAEKNKMILHDIKQRYHISQQDIDKWFNKTGFHHLVRCYEN